MASILRSSLSHIWWRPGFKTYGEVGKHHRNIYQVRWSSESHKDGESLLVRRQFPLKQASTILERSFVVHGTPQFVSISTDRRFSLHSSSSSSRWMAWQASHCGCGRDLKVVTTRLWAVQERREWRIHFFKRSIKQIYSYCHSLLIPKTLENRSAWSIIIETLHAQYLIPSSRGHDINCLYCVVAQSGLP